MKTPKMAFALVLVAAPFHADLHAQGLNLGGATTVGRDTVTGPGGLGAPGAGIPGGGIGLGGLGGGGLGGGLGGGGLGGGGLGGGGLGGGGLGGGGLGGGGLGGGGLGGGAGGGGLGGGAGAGIGGLGAGIGGAGSAVGPGGGISVTGPASGLGSTGIGPGVGGGLGFTLPALLRPDDRRRVRRKRGIYAYLTELGNVLTTPEDVARDRIPLRAITGTPYQTVAACRGAILRAAQQYNPVFATTASGGALRKIHGGRGGALAPIQTKLIYLREDGYEVKQAKVNCRLTADGGVVGLS
jgi:hypothetical protein